MRSWIARGERRRGRLAERLRQQRRRLVGVQRAQRELVEPPRPAQLVAQPPDPVLRAGARRSGRRRRPAAAARRARRRARPARSSVASSDHWRSSRTTSAGRAAVMRANAQRSASNSVAPVGRGGIAQLGQQHRQHGAQRAAARRARPGARAGGCEARRQRAVGRGACRGPPRRAGRARPAPSASSRDQPRLADARLAGQQHDRAVARTRGAQPRIERGALGPATDEWRAHGADITGPATVRPGNTACRATQVRQSGRCPAGRAARTVAPDTERAGRGRPERSAYEPLRDRPPQRLRVRRRPRGARRALDRRRRQAGLGRPLDPQLRLAEDSGELGTFCIYEAESPEAIRAHAAASGLPVDEIVPVADTVIVRPDPVPATA